MKGWPENSAQTKLGITSSFFHSRGAAVFNSDDNLIFCHNTDELKASLRFALIQMNSRTICNRPGIEPQPSSQKKGTITVFPSRLIELNLKIQWLVLAFINKVNFLKFLSFIWKEFAFLCRIFLSENECAKNHQCWISVKVQFTTYDISVWNWIEPLNVNIHDGSLFFKVIEMSFYPNIQNSLFIASWLMIKYMLCRAQTLTPFTLTRQVGIMASMLASHPGCLGLNTTAFLSETVCTKNYQCWISVVGTIYDIFAWK